MLALDSTTRSEYDAEATVYVKVYDGAGTVKASGTLLSFEEAVPPRSSQQFVLRVTPGGELERQAA